jgi:hypothetical protein
MSEPIFDERRFMPREQAEADDTIDLHEHDDPGPRYKRIVQRLFDEEAESDAAMTLRAKLKLWIERVRES